MKVEEVAQPARVLLVEDDERDVMLVLRALQDGGVRCIHHVVRTEQGLRAALEEFAPHVVLSDFSLPGFGGLEALRICQNVNPDIPFIFVSGTIGEERAVEGMRAGSVDYVMKTNMTRLGPAVRRELGDAIRRRERRIAEAGLRRAQLLARLAHVVTGPVGEFESWSETLPALIGVGEAEVPRDTRSFMDRVHPADRDRFRDTALRAARDGRRADLEYRIRGVGGQWVHVRQVMEPLERVPDRPGRLRWFNTVQDVTEEARAQERIRRLNRVYSVLSGINTLIVRVRDREELLREACRIAVHEGKFPNAWLGDFSQGAFRIRIGFGGDRAFYETLERQLTEKLAQHVGLVNEALASRRAVIVNDIEKEPHVLLRSELLDAGVRSMAVLPVIVGDRASAVLVINADTPDFFDEQEERLLTELCGNIGFALENIEKSERIEYLSFYDILTGLANRTLFHERLQQALSAAARSSELLAVVVLDLERFRTVNDSLGRHAGDALIRMVAERMRAHVPDAAWCARLGADHFALYVPDVASYEQIAATTASLLKDVFGSQFTIDGHELWVSARAGIAVYPNDASDADTLFRNAEAAANKARHSGERYVFFEKRMAERVADKLSLANKLRRALEQDEFVLHYQPRVTLQVRRIVGVEALLRWRSRELGLVSPAEFVPLLEETGFIVQVGAWALRQAVLDHRSWVERGLDAPRVAVNVSALQLRQRDFIETVHSALAAGAQPPGLDVEITESLLMEDLRGTIAKLEALGRMGVNVAIDDFGTGYSSLSYLAKLPVQSLKIDRSFISTMHDDPNAMTLVSTIISLAHSLGLKVVAEGVETEEQARILRLLRCDEKQGYLFSRPIPADELVALIQRNEETRA